MLDDPRAAVAWKPFVAMVAAEIDDAVGIKVQLAGPITTSVALGRSGSVERVANSARGLVDDLDAAGIALDRVVVFLDEPSLVLWARGEQPWSREDAVGDVTACVEAIRRRGATAGVHVCGDGDATIAFEAQPLIVHATVANATACRDAVVRHCQRGGLIGWGVSPNVAPDDAWLVLNHAIVATGAVDLVTARSMVMPECGLAGFVPDHARAALAGAAALASRLRAYGQ